MKPSCSRMRGFTLIETVLAIGVLAVLLTGFMVVFAPAAAGIRKSLNVQEADRLATTVEQELVTVRPGQAPAVTTGFAKAFDWIKNSNTAGTALLVYQYRGSLTSVRADGTPEPVPTVTNKQAGKDYVLVPMVRRATGDANFTTDLAALEGGVYLVKCTQLVFSGGYLKTGTAGTIVDTKGVVAGTTDAYAEAVIAVAADFYTLPAKSAAFFTSGFTTTFGKALPAGPQKPVFSRNLAVRR